MGYHLKAVELPKRTLSKLPKIVSEYDQEIPQSQTADKPHFKIH